MMQELTDKQILDISDTCFTPVGREWEVSFARAVIAAAVAQQADRHAEELAAYEVTVSNLHSAVNELAEALTKRLLPESVCDKDPRGCWNIRCQLGKKCVRSAAPAPEPELSDAYTGAREDLAIWKKRALEAEETVRQLTRALAEEVNGPTFMGEPVIQAQPERKPMTESELSKIMPPGMEHRLIAFARAIEAHHNILPQEDK